MELLKAADFVPHVGKTVWIKGTPHTLVLDRVEGEDAPPPPGYLRSPFLVIFRGPKGEVVPAGVYDVAFEEGPTFNLYVAPIHTAAPDRQEYQSAFN